jgi:hypothetical protein
MIAIFNPDMESRIADLSSAMQVGHAVTVEYHAAFQQMPERVLVSVAKTGRRFALDRPTAMAVADQLDNNASPEMAMTLRDAFAGA